MEQQKKKASLIEMMSRTFSETDGNRLFTFEGLVTDGRGGFGGWFDRNFRQPPNTLILAGTKRNKLIHPQSNFFVLWSFIMILLLGYISVGVPLRLAFDGGDACTLDQSGLLYLDCTSDSLFVLDIILTFFTSRVVNNVLTDDMKLIARDYFQSTLIFDAIVSFPVSWLQIIIVASGNCTSNLAVIQLLKVLKGLRLVRLMRLKNARKFMSNLTIHNAFFRNPNVKNLLKLNIFMIFCVHCVACLWWYVKRQDPHLAEWEISHTAAEDGDVSRYIACFYFAITTLTTTGYGDISGDTDLERITASACMFIGGLLFAAIISNVSTLTISLVASSNRHEARKAEVVNFMQARKIPLSLQQQVTQYFDRFASESSVEGTEILDELPATLKYRMLKTMALNTLTKVHIFRNLEVELLMAIFIKLTPLRCAPGEILVREGHHGTNVLFLMQGGAVVIKEDKVVDELKEGDVFGALKIFSSDDVHSASLVTKDFSELYVLEKSALFEVLKRFPGSDKMLMRRAQVLHRYRLGTSPPLTKSHSVARFASHVRNAVTEYKKRLKVNTIVPSSIAEDEIEDSPRSAPDETQMEMTNILPTNATSKSTAPTPIPASSPIQTKPRLLIDTESFSSTNIMAAIDREEEPRDTDTNSMSEINPITLNLSLGHVTKKRNSVSMRRDASFSREQSVDMLAKLSRGRHHSNLGQSKTSGQLAPLPFALPDDLSPSPSLAPPAAHLVTDATKFLQTALLFQGQSKEDRAESLRALRHQLHSLQLAVDHLSTST